MRVIYVPLPARPEEAPRFNHERFFLALVYMRTPEAAHERVLEALLEEAENYARNYGEGATH